MAVITAYLSIDNDIYMKIRENFKLFEANNIKSRSICTQSNYNNLYID